MKPILVHCHIYYPNLWPELKNCILNIEPYSFDLYVTISENKINNSILDDVKQSFKNARVDIVENRGYDVWPFINIINNINLDQYSYIIKIHSKRDMHIGAMINDFNVEKERWRKYALSPIMLKSNFEKCMDGFISNPKLGMIGNYRLILSAKNDDKKTKKIVIEYIRERGSAINDYSFVAGTMFICKADLLKPLKSMKFKSKDFDVCEGIHNKITLAHIMERYFGVLVLEQGYEIKDAYSEKQHNSIIWHYLMKFTHFLYRKKLNPKGKIRIKICKIPVFTFSQGNKK